MRRLRIATLLVLVAAFVAGTAGVALANTELVPASRIVFPYIDISSGRETFLLLTNTGTETVFLHLEFYSQKCDRQDTSTKLTRKDLSVVVVSQVSSVASPNFLLGVAGNPAVTKQQNVFGIGWLDVDVRANCGGNLRGCDGLQYNGVLGTAVVIDVNRDFAFAYPGAAAQGSSEGSCSLCTIVEREPDGTVSNWIGTYETYPSTIFIPAYFAETACTPDADLAAFLAIAGPADAWRKEGPGDDLGQTTGATALVRTQANLYDGAENSDSDEANAHYVNGQLCNVYDASALRGQYDVVPPFSINTPGAYATADDFQGQINTVGWIEIFSGQRSRFGAASPAGLPNNPFFSNGNNFDDSQRNRGLVAVLFEVQDETITIGEPPVTGAVHIGDAIRGWGDPATQIDWPCFGTESTVGIAPPTVLQGSFDNAPSCDDENPPFSAVPPSWLGDNAETPGGIQRD